MKKLFAVMAAMAFVLAIGAAGALAGDSLLHSLDPSKVPGYVELETGSVTLAEPVATFIERGSAAGGMSKEPDTFLNDIDPSRTPGFVEPETGAVVGTGPKAFAVRGSAAGGMGMEHDTFINYIAGDENKIIY